MGRLQQQCCAVWERKVNPGAAPWWGGNSQGSHNLCDHTPGPVGPMVCRGASQAPPRGARAAYSEGYEVYYLNSWILTLGC
jgi:hypothetical protein